MPNWVENELTVRGPDVQKVLAAIRSEADGDDDARVFDFDRVIPYPAQYKELDQRARGYQEKLRAIAHDDPDRQDKLNALAAEYGADPGVPWIADGFNAGGYEWCCESWGCKWNASHATLTLRPDREPSSPPRTTRCSFCQTVYNTAALNVRVCQQCGSPLPAAEADSALIEFDTPWSPPIPVIAALAAMFPDHHFELKYFEGGMGFSGHACWSEGIEQFHDVYEYNGTRGG